MVLEFLLVKIEHAGDYIGSYNLSVKKSHVQTKFRSTIFSLLFETIFESFKCLFEKA